MQDKRKLDNYQIVLLLLAAAFSIITFALQITNFVLVRHIILSLIIVAFMIGVIVIDVILKEYRRVFSHTIYSVIWILNLIFAMWGDI